MPGNGRSSAVSFSINGLGYIALGRDSLKNTLTDCWAFDPVNNKWTSRKTFPGFPRVKAIAAVSNGKAYVGLGFNPNYGVYTDTIAYLNDFWMYDPVLDYWSPKANFPGTERDGCVAFEYKNEIFVGAGFNGYGFGREFWKYNPATDKWTEVPDFVELPRTCSVACTDGEHVYYGTGYNTFNNNDWWEYFPETGSWKMLKPMPDAGRETAVSFSLQHRFFVSTGRQFGGNFIGGFLKADIMEYDAIKNVWYNRGNVPNGGRENALVFILNDKAYIGFGENDNTVLNDLWSFEP